MSTPIIQVSSGSFNYQQGTNWSTLAQPAAADDAYLSNSAASCTLGFVNTLTLTSLNIPLTYTGLVGLSATNVTTLSISGITRVSTTATATTAAAHGLAAGDSVTVSGAVETDYNITATLLTASGSTFTYTVANAPSTPATGTISYRRYIYLKQPATTTNIGIPGASGQSSGSGRILHDGGTAQATWNIFATGTATDTDYDPVRILGSHASNVLNMLGGQAGVANTFTSETATLLTVNQTGGVLNCGPGLTWTTIKQAGGTLSIKSGAASGTLTQTKGSTAFVSGAGTIGDLVIGGTMYLNIRKATAGDTVVNTLQMDDGAVLDLRGNPSAISAGTFKTNGDVTVYTNPANPNQFTYTTLSRQPGSTITFK